MEDLGLLGYTVVDLNQAGCSSPCLRTVRLLLVMQECIIAFKYKITIICNSELLLSLQGFPGINVVANVATRYVHLQVYVF